MTRGGRVAIFFFGALPATLWVYAAFNVLKPGPMLIIPVILGGIGAAGLCMAAFQSNSDTRKAVESLTRIFVIIGVVVAVPGILLMLTIASNVFGSGLVGFLFLGAICPVVAALSYLFSGQSKSSQTKHNNTLQQTGER